MESLGQALQIERVRRGLELEQLAECTRINPSLLEAMEANHFELLPGGVFTRSFVRQYARALNLDEEQAMASFEREFQQPPLPLPPPLPESKPLHLHFARLVVWLLISAGLYTIWERVHSSSPLGVTSSAVNLTQKHWNSDCLATEHVQAEPNVLTAMRPRLPATSDKRGADPSPAIGLMRVVFEAREPVWISIESDGSHVYTGILEEQQNKELHAAGKIVALIGNAGGLEVLLNGKRIGPVGRHGQVRLLELTPAGARVIDRTNPEFYAHGLY